MQRIIFQQLSESRDELDLGRGGQFKIHCTITASMVNDEMP